MVDATLLGAAAIGLASFFAPCILPMVPAFLAYISGSSMYETRGSGAGGGGRSGTLLVNRTNIVLNTVFFVLGFTVVFSIYSVVINSVFSGVTNEVTEAFNQAGGIIIVGFGLYMLLSTRIRLLNFEKKFVPKNTKSSFPLSFLFGLSFAAAWTPCTAPVLGTILTVAAMTPAAAMGLMLAYSLGLGIPFVVMGVFFSRATRIIRAMSRHLRYYSVVLGAFIIVLGVLVFFNQLAYIASFPLLNDLVMLSSPQGAG